MPLSCVVIPTDFSAWSRRALERVAMLPMRARPVIHLVHVAPRGRSDLAGAKDNLGKLAKLLGELRVTLGLSRPTVHVHVRRGEPWSEIVQAARAVQADLIVLGRKGAGRGVGQVLGRTAARVTLRSGAPVLVVGPPPRGPYRKPLLALQLDSSVMAQVSLLNDLLEPAVKRVLAVHAYHVPYEGLIAPDEPAGSGSYQKQVLADVSRSVRQFLKELPSPGIRMRVRMVKDMPAPAVLRTARQERADLICTGTHARKGLARAFLGSVAESVICGADRDVVVARPVRYTR